MQIQPNSNLEPEKEENGEQAPVHVGGDYIHITGSVGPGASIGRGSVTAHNIAGGNITTNGKLQEERAEFTRLILELKDLVLEAHNTGELNDNATQKVVKSLFEAAEMATKESKPAKSKIMRKLEYVADVLDAAVDFLGSRGGAAKILVKAMPVAALLIKVAGRIF